MAYARVCQWLAKSGEVPAARPVGHRPVPCGRVGEAAPLQVTASSLVIGGSHLTGTVTIDGKAFKIWDHTVSTGANGIAIAGTGTSRVVSGTVTVQHNLLGITTTSTFNSVAYGNAACCFPTGGNVTTTFENGSDLGKTETLVFSSACGEATLTPAGGAPESLTLAHCL